MKLFTIGYEGATVAELVAALARAGVQHVADVRAVTTSRRPGFSKNILAATLREHGIGYTHYRALGTPKEGREAARSGDRAGLERVYAGQLDLPESQMDAARLLEIAKERPTALLCYERDPHLCHRSILLTAVAEGAEVVDLEP